MDPSYQQADEDNELEAILHILCAEEQRVQDALFEEEELVSLAAIAVGLFEAHQTRTTRRYRNRLYLTRPQLLSNPRKDTPWQRLYESLNDRAFITTMGVDVNTFLEIVDSGFELMWNTQPIPRNDIQPAALPRLTRRSLDAHGALGLVLHFLNSTMTETTLSEVFALIPSTVSRYLSFGLKLLLLTLREMPEALISWPEGAEFLENSNLITVRHPMLDGAFGIMDGLKLPVQTSSDEDVENATYNGWLHEHFISNVFAFSPTGVIIACRINCPGSWHDSRVAQPIYEKLRNETPEGFYLVADTAFPRGTDQIAGRIKTPRKQGAAWPQEPTAQLYARQFDVQLVSFRQAAEWGMRTMQGSFGRLRIPLSINEINLRGDLIESCSRLFNLRARKVGHNQIRSVYMPIWKDGDQGEVWLSFENMLFSHQRQHDRVSRFHRST